MKIFMRALLVMGVLAAGQGMLSADSGYSFSFTAEQKHTTGKKTETYYETAKEQEWSYLVKMENKSFKDVSDIEIKYVIFSKQVETDVITTGEGMQRKTGTVSIKQIKNNDTVEFSTDSVELTNVSYSDGYYTDSGVKGALRGIWLRVYVGGQMVAEFMNPQGLSSKEKFDAPASAPKKKNTGPSF